MGLHLTSAMLGGRTSTDVPSGLILLVPVGSTEQHGPHLPLDTDTRVALALATAAAERIGRHRVVVAPALPYGSSGEHQMFSGTLSIGHDALVHVLVELGRSATETFDAVVFVHGHGGNLVPAAKAVALLQAEARAVRSWIPQIRDGDAHAGRTETSLLLAIAPEAVRVERAQPGDIRPLLEIYDQLVTGGVGVVSPNGVLGDPTGATAEEGRRLLAALTDSLVALVLELWPRRGHDPPAPRP